MIKVSINTPGGNRSPIWIPYMHALYGSYMDPLYYQSLILPVEECPLEFPTRILDRGIPIGTHHGSPQGDKYG